MDNVILTQKTADDLISQITSRVLSGVAVMLKESREVDLQSKEWLNSKEVETVLKISAVTRWSWGKEGILNPHKINKVLRYRKDEVLQALIKIESKKGLR